MRRTLPFTTLFLTLFCFLGTLTFAESGKGSLTGRVADSADAVLQGAQVELLPKSGTATTNYQGEFTFTNLTPGTYTVLINYVGFEPFSQEVTIIAGKKTQIKALIKISSKNEEVTVFSERQSGEVEAINRTRAAENILQVLPAEVITSLPNANIADALGRMPSVTIERDEGEGKYVQIRGTEPRLSNVMVDGITIPSPESGVRQIKLDTIASDLVDSVEINKTLQANIDGDGIGGSVNLVTKTASETPTFNLYGLGGYTPISTHGREVMQGGGTMGQRFGAQKKLGILIGGTYDYNGRGINDIEPSPTANSVTPHYDSIDLRDYVYDRTRWGAAGSVDYKLGEGSSLYMRSLFSTFRNWGHKWVFTLNDYDNPKASQDWRRPNMAVANVVLGGTHHFSDSAFTWSAAVGRSRSLSGSGSAKYKWAGDSAIANNCFNQPGVSVNRPGWSSGCFGTGTDNAVDINNYYLSGFTLPNSGKSAQLNLTGSADYSKNYHVGTHFGSFALGGKVRNGHKFDDSYQIAANLPGKPLVSANPEWDSNFTDSNYYDKTYHIGPVTDYSKVRSWVTSNGYLASAATNVFVPQSTPSVINPANYDYVERVSAGYLMNTIDLSSRVRLVAGLRFEATHLSTLGYTDTGSADNNGNEILTSSQATGDYLNVLPSAALRIALDKRSNLRIVYGRGLARPNPQDVTPSIQDTGNTYYANNVEIYTKGNPGLKAEYANNYDVLYEAYLQPSGLIQVGYFYKDISSPIIPFTTAGTFEGQQVVFEEQTNAKSAHVQGIELGYQQHLSFLPGALRGLGISANYSYTSSQISMAGRTDHPALLRQAPNTWNISPTFDARKFSLRVGMTYNGAMIYQYYDFTQGTPTLGAKGPAGDNYLYSHYQIDLQGSYNVTRNLQVYAYGLNLNNEVFGFYNGSPQYVVQREYYKPTYAGGLRYNFTRER